jgi:hypothetical protein
MTKFLNNIRTKFQRFLLLKTTLLKASKHLALTLSKENPTKWMYLRSQDNLAYYQKVFLFLATLSSFSALMLSTVNYGLISLGLYHTSDLAIVWLTTLVPIVIFPKGTANAFGLMTTCNDLITVLEGLQCARFLSHKHNWSITTEIRRGFEQVQAELPIEFKREIQTLDTKNIVREAIVTRSTNILSTANAYILLMTTNHHLESVDTNTRYLPPPFGVPGDNTGTVVFDFNRPVQAIDHIDVTLHNKMAANYDYLTQTLLDLEIKMPAVQYLLALEKIISDTKILPGVISIELLTYLSFQVNNQEISLTAKELTFYLAINNSSVDEKNDLISNMFYDVGIRP